MPISACLAVTYGAIEGQAASPAIDATTTIDPWRSRRLGRAARNTTNAVFTLVCHDDAQSSSLTSASAPPPPLAALAITTSTPPATATHVSTAIAATNGSAASPTIAVPPHARATACNGSARRPMSTT